MSAAAVFPTALRGASPSPQWTQIETREKNDTAVPGSEDAETVEVDVQGGDIYISVGKKADVQVFTILGQLVTRRSVPAGTSRLRLPAKGMYILKIGPQTRRINL